jgi:hypothetical protein
LIACGDAIFAKSLGGALPLPYKDKQQFILAKYTAKGRKKYKNLHFLQLTKTGILCYNG